ncbi:hypothetical protein [Caulobacter sp. BE254]|uniref:hypothetical protein n=1 Tax=Caulobacter sp. BE254 TaxID=2817720 RepID=UPI00285E9664|nr:hypothetical protein [Caulobacter sp. BE254]MDR7116025.1 plasmid stabilization system protein ParE [Caulobacter sp. BE254]
MSREGRLTARAKHDLSRLEAFLIAKNPDAARRAVEYRVSVRTVIIARIKHALERP